ncbi:glycosyltransferase [Ktedonosporobacter rubrisoli]|uniref:Glycosyltransferase n=1 Tax=Ktedonosporobacter rubrisoli TaxID=2509675 RepID=A0A4P6K637_KTERU|nr:glycosyltransferase [Ktedonosporobacter rubrisoli]
MANVTQRTILFLIADTGAGHRSAANAITTALKLISQRDQEEWQTRRQGSKESGQESEENRNDSIYPPPTYRIEIVDVFEEYSRFPLREVVKLYGPTIRYNPKLFGDLFHRSNREGTVLAANSLASPLIFNGLLRLFTTVQPDVIVSIHPLINFVTVRALRKLGLHIPFITVVTDLVSVHYAWFAPGVDGYIVPTEQAKELYLKRGLDPQRVHLLGMPIDPKFTRAVDDKVTLQRKLGLEPGIPVALLVGGGDGAGGLPTAVRAISQARLPVQLLVVTGRNRRLYAHLQRTHTKLHVPARIFGFVHNMPELMHAADVIVTKAGPGTICEALSCNLPVVLSGYVPGQEEGNVDFVLKNEVGMLALHASELVNGLRRLIKPGSPELQKYLRNASQVSRPGASFDIARCILSYLPAPDQVSVWQSSQWQRRQRMMSGRLRSAIRIRRLRGRLPRPILRSPVMRKPQLRVRELFSSDGDASES